MPVVVGVRFALEPGRGANSVPARTALLGAVSGVLGVIAAFTFAVGVSDAAAHPGRFGQDYQFTVVFGSGGHDFLPNGPVLSALATDPAVSGITDLRIDAASSGGTSVLAHSYDPVGAPVPLVLTAGAPPARDDELVLAPATARRLGARVGSVVPLAGDRGTRQMRVTGIGFTMESSTAPYDNVPIALGGFLTLLAIGAVGYALMTAVWRRSRDIAILRALGMTPSQCWRAGCCWP